MIYNKTTRSLYIEMYEVDEALAGNHLGTDYLRRALTEAEKAGPVEVITGKAGHANARKLLGEGGRLDPLKIGETPWARSWDELGWKTELKGTVMTTTRK
jgi:hypothetical protein